MIRGTIVLCILLCTVYGCDIYVDGRGGSDAEGCGTTERPCLTITSDRMDKELCVSGGVYTMTTRIPALISRWNREGQNERPTFTCSNGVKIVNISESSGVSWNQIDIKDCTITSELVMIVEIIQVALSNSSFGVAVSHQHRNFTLSHSTLNATFVWAQGRDNWESFSSIFSATNNTLLNSTLYMQFSKQISVISNDIDVHSIININPYDSANITGNRGQGSLSAPVGTGAFLSTSSVIVQDNDLHEMFMFGRTKTMAEFSRNKIANLTLQYKANFAEKLTGHTLSMMDNDITHFTLDSSLGLYQLNMTRNRFQTASLQVSAHSLKSTYHVSDNVMKRLIYERYNCIDTGNSTEDFHDNHIDTFHYTSCSSLQTNLDIHHSNMSSLVISLGAVHDHKAAPSVIGIRNCRFVGSPIGNPTASAIDLSNMNGAVVNVTYCEISGYVSSTGAGLAIYNSAAVSFYLGYTTIQHCRAETGGAVSIVSDYSDIVVDHCRLSFNTATLDSGAISIWGTDNNHITITNSIMQENRAPHGSAFTLSAAGAIQVLHNSITVVMDHINIDADNTVAVSGNPMETHNTLWCPTGTRIILNGSYADQSDTYVWTCSPCEDGSYIIGSGYVINGTGVNTECTDCPPHVKCQNGGKPKVEGGYWCGVTNDNKMKCYDCPNDYCYSKEHDWDDSCTGNRQGVLCGECKRGYTMGFLSTKCINVDNCDWGWTLLLFLVPFAYVILLLVLPIGDGSIWKSTSYFVQTFPLLIDRTVQKKLGGILTLVVSPSGGDFSTEFGICIGYISYVQRELISLYIPLCTVTILAACCLVGVVYEKVKGRWNRNSIVHRGRSRFSRCSTALITSCLLVYSGVISICLKLMFCVEIEQNGHNVYRMYNAGNISCGGTWRSVLYALSGFILLPAPFFLIFIRRKMKLSRSGTSRDVRLVLDGCYRHRYKWWETVYMLRRLVVTMVYVLTADSKWTLLAMRLLSVASLSSHLIFRPFSTFSGQSLETACLLSLTCLSSMRGSEYDTEWSIYPQIILIIVPLCISFYYASRKLWVKARNAYRRWREERRKKRRSQQESSEEGERTALVSSS
ncbi:hypothetical protein PROFUN_07461 [Planoprotostelium fungivorum]|uniref:Right handed beta helix domain-containing protein n=1 Tax=Planoprotostelium fungivorum TaxID=1890364 RepID=A0A2P6NLI0_9EUKA|nr:hypothetical protein PROFUN_07461 [Planoprotostelium fungivorum]